MKKQFNKLLALSLVINLVVPFISQAETLPTVKYVSDYNEKFYEDDDYQGVLEPYVKGGDFVPAESKIIEGKDTENYEDEFGFKGKLTPYVFAGSDAGTKQVNNYPNQFYHDGVYSGTLTTPDQIIGYTEELSKRVTAQNTADYTDAQGYSGTLTQYLHSGVYTPPATLYVDSQLTATYNKDGYVSPAGGLTPYQEKIVIVPDEQKSVDVIKEQRNISRDTSAQCQWGITPNNQSYVHGDGTFSGTVSFDRWVLTDTVYHKGNKDHSIDPWVVCYYNLYYKGILIKPGQFTYETRYKGTVTKPASDTRVYKFEGYVFKPPQPIYSYKGTVSKPDTREYKYGGPVIKPAIDTRVYGYQGVVKLKYKPTAPTIESAPIAEVPSAQDKELQNNSLNMVLNLPTQGDYYQTSLDGINWSEWLRKPSNTNEIKFPLSSGEGEKTLYYRTGTMKFEKERLFDGFAIREFPTERRLFEPASQIVSTTKIIDRTSPTIKFKTDNNTYVVKTGGTEVGGTVSVVVDVKDNLDQSPLIEIQLGESNNQGQLDRSTLKLVKSEYKDATKATMTLSFNNVKPLLIDEKIQPYHLLVSATDAHGNKTEERTQIYVKP